MSNYPMGFNGLEGREEDNFVIEYHGEVEIEHFTEEDAIEEFKKYDSKRTFRSGACNYLILSTM